MDTTMPQVGDTIAYTNPIAKPWVVTSVDEHHVIGHTAEGSSRSFAVSDWPSNRYILKRANGAQPMAQPMAQASVAARTTNVCITCTYPNEYQHPANRPTGWMCTGCRLWRDRT